MVRAWYEEVGVPLGAEEQHARRRHRHVVHREQLARQVQGRQGRRGRVHLVLLRTSAARRWRIRGLGAIGCLRSRIVYCTPMEHSRAHCLRTSET